MLKSVMVASVVGFLATEALAAGFGTNGHLCEIRDAYAPSGEACVVNRNFGAAGMSNALVIDGPQPEIMLLKQSGGANGACAVETPGTCATIRNTGLSFGELCSLDRSTAVRMSCPSSAPIWRPQPEAVRATGSALRLLEVADQLQADDWEVLANGDYYAFLGPRLARRAVRLVGPGAHVVSLELPEALTEPENLLPAIDAIDRNLVPLSEVRSLGTGGALLVRRGGADYYLPPTADCTGPCVLRQLRDTASFQTEIERLNDLADMELLPFADAEHVRELLIEKLLLGSVPAPDIDSQLAALGAVQPPELLLFEQVP